MVNQSSMSVISRLLGLGVFLGLCLGAGGLGAIATTSEVTTWYQELAKPSWNPPSCVFGPVWSALFIMMAFAGWLVWQPRGLSQAAVPLTLWRHPLPSFAARSPLAG
jgi:tryptophan-rich sensory protein